MKLSKYRDNLAIEKKNIIMENIKGQFKYQNLILFWLTCNVNCEL